MAAMLCYLPICCIGFVVALLAALTEKNNRFVRFHGFQSLLAHGAMIVVVIVAQVLGFALGMVSSILGLLFSLLFGVIGLALLVAMVLMMVKAYGNEEYELPVIGPMAKNWAK
jgi:uncharacterized membrane protein